MKGRDGSTGPWIEGLMDAHDIPRKTVTAKSGVHPSTFSRFVNGINDINDRQLVQIGMAIGEARAEAEHKRGTR